LTANDRPQWPRRGNWQRIFALGILAASDSDTVDEAPSSEAKLVCLWENQFI
jgi:hypothetical protein